MRLQAIVHNATNGEQCDLSFHHGTLFFSMVAMNQVTKLIQINQRQASHLACLNHWAPYSPQSLCSGAWEETCDKHRPSHSCRSDINGCIFLQQQDDDAKCSVLNECPLIRFRRSSLPSLGRNLLTHNALVHSTCSHTFITTPKNLIDTPQTNDIDIRLINQPTSDHLLAVHNCDGLPIGHANLPHSWELVTTSTILTKKNSRPTLNHSKNPKKKPASSNVDFSIRKFYP